MMEEASVRKQSKNYLILLIPRLMCPVLRGHTEERRSLGNRGRLTLEKGGSGSVLGQVGAENPLRQNGPGKGCPKGKEVRPRGEGLGWKVGPS